MNERIETALEFHRNGYDLVMLLSNTKVAAFKGYQNRGPPTRPEIVHWLRRGLNYGIWLRLGILAIDYDTDTEERLRSPMETITRKGRHVFQRYDGEPRRVIHPNGEPVDYLANGYVVGPESVVQEFRYQLAGVIVPKEKLPVFQDSLFQKPTRNKNKEIHYLNSDEKIRRARKGLDKIISISGSGTGDLNLFKAACWCCQTMKLNEEEALSVLREWNADGVHCLPPWPDSRLVYKVREAIRLKGL